jgi:hypothetical protein
MGRIGSPPNFLAEFFDRVVAIGFEMISSMHQPGRGSMIRQRDDGGQTIQRSDMQFDMRSPMIVIGFMMQ